MDTSQKYTEKAPDLKENLKDCVSNGIGETLDKRTKVSKEFFIGTGYNYDACVRGATFGLDEMWKKSLLSFVPPDAKKVLDLACGTGIVTCKILDKCKDTEILGVDITEDYVAVARDKLSKRNEKDQGRVDFHIANAETTDLTGRGPFDVVVSSYIPKYVDPHNLMNVVEPVLAPGAKLAFHDFDVPHAFWKPIWKAHMRTFSVLGPKLWGDEWGACFESNLEELIEKSEWAKCYKEALERRGWSDVKIHRITLGGASIVSGTWRGADPPAASTM